MARYRSNDMMVRLYVELVMYAQNGYCVTHNRQYRSVERDPRGKGIRSLVHWYTTTTIHTSRSISDWFKMRRLMTLPRSLKMRFQTLLTLTKQNCLWIPVLPFFSSYLSPPFFFFFSPSFFSFLSGSFTSFDILFLPCYFDSLSLWTNLGNNGGTILKCFSKKSIIVIIIITNNYIILKKYSYPLI